MVSAVPFLSLQSISKACAAAENPEDFYTEHGDKSGWEGESKENKINKMDAQEVALYIGKKNDPMIKQGESLITKGDFKKAVEIFQDIIEKSPIDPRPYYLLAILYSRLEQEDQIYRVLEQATEYNTDFDLVFGKFLEQTAPKSNTPEEARKETIWIAPFKNNTSCAISFVFDDGPRNVYTYGLPIFEQFGFKATVTLNPGFITEHTHKMIGTWEHWRDAHTRGFEIGNHGMNHNVLRGQPQDILEYEINGSFDIITEKIGEAPLAFVFPRGRGFFDENGVQKALERHPVILYHDFLLKIYLKVLLPTFGGEDFSLKTAQEITDLAMDKKIWLVAQSHSLKAEQERTFKPMTKEFLRDYLSYLKKNEDRIWVDTFGNIYRYVYEKKETKIIIENQADKGMTFKLENSLDPRVYSMPLTVVISPPVKKIAKASARQGNKPLAVKIRNSTLFIDVLPESPPVTVKWK